MPRASAQSIRAIVTNLEEKLHACSVTEALLLRQLEAVRGERDATEYALKLVTPTTKKPPKQPAAVTGSSRRRKSASDDVQPAQPASPMFDEPGEAASGV